MKKRPEKGRMATRTRERESGKGVAQPNGPFTTRPGWRGSSLGREHACAGAARGRQTWPWRRPLGSGDSATTRVPGPAPSTRHGRLPRGRAPPESRPDAGRLAPRPPARVSERPLTAAANPSLRALSRAAVSDGLHFRGCRGTVLARFESGSPRRREAEVGAVSPSGWQCLSFLQLLPWNAIFFSTLHEIFGGS